MTPGSWRGCELDPWAPREKDGVLTTWDQSAFRQCSLKCAYIFLVINVKHTHHLAR